MSNAMQDALDAGRTGNLEVFVLLDRSGSMIENGKWTETVGGINAFVEQTVKELKNPTDKDTVTVVTFDGEGYGGGPMHFDTIRDRQKIREWKSLDATTVTPRGSTPLLDAVMQMTALVNKTDALRKVLVIITDGQENASTEMKDKKKEVKEAIEALHQKNYQVLFLASQFDDFTDAQTLGVRGATTASMAMGQTADILVKTAGYVGAYANIGQNIAYTDQDRAQAATPKPKAP